MCSFDLVLSICGRVVITPSISISNEMSHKDAILLHEPVEIHFAISQKSQLTNVKVMIKFYEHTWEWAGKI